MSEKDHILHDVEAPSSSLQQSLIDDSNREGDANYLPVLPASRMKLFGYYEVESDFYAKVTAITQIFSVLSLMSSLYSYNDDNNILVENVILYSYYMIFLCWFIVPMWQCFVFKRKDSNEYLKLDNGFICCRLISFLCGMCCGKYELIYRNESNSNHTRYLPFSIYNYVYMMNNPGQQLNPELPPNLEEFGFSRTFLLCLSTNAMGTLNSYIYIYAIHQLYTSNSNLLSKSLALTSAGLACIGYQITVISIVYGILLLPYAIGLYFAFFLYDCCYCTNPRRNTCIFNTLKSLWKCVAKLS